ncbi:MAG: flagellar hook-associated protein FlgK [Chloroflexi bacterium]|nr:flagellar hook-associated protein FlgK [Chloroflexota bacterium]
MRSSFMGLTTLLRALQAQQTALDVTNQNIANANTDGYTRQEAKLVQTAPFAGTGFNRPAGGGLMLGTGVMVQEITRQRDAYVDQQLRAQIASQQKAQILSDGVQQVEAIFNEPSNYGLSSQMARFFNAWSELSNNPGSATARTQLQAQGQALASGFRDVAQQLDQYRSDQDSQIMSVVAEVNDVAVRIADLNLQIRKSVGNGDRPNDLMDARDRLVDQITKLSGATTREETDGSTTVNLGGRLLVSGSRANSITAELTPLASGKASHTLTWWPGSGNVEGSGGTLGGLLQMRDAIIPEKLTKINLLASTIVTQVNAQHAKGMGLGVYATMTTGTDFFDTQRSITTLQATGLGDVLTAGSITIGSTQINIDPSTKSLNDVLAQIATALGPGSTASIDDATGRIVLTYAAAGSPTIGADGDSSMAINALSTTQMSALGSSTFDDYYASLIGELGVQSRQSLDMATTQKALVDHLTTRRESNSGVNLDEEAAQLIRFQRAYQAAARGITALDDLLPGAWSFEFRANLRRSLKIPAGLPIVGTGQRRLAKLQRGWTLRNQRADEDEEHACNHPNADPAHGSQHHGERRCDAADAASADYRKAHSSAR